MNDWQAYWGEGGKFLETASKGYELPGKFNSDALFNLAAIALEKTGMALLIKESSMPEGHTFRDLASGLDKIAPLPGELKEELIGLDALQAGFCSLESDSPDPISRNDIPPMLKTCRRLRDYVSANLA